MVEGKINIKINEKGELEVKTHGIYGPACIEEVNKLLEELALITSCIKTDEYHMGVHVKERSPAKQEVKH